MVVEIKRLFDGRGAFSYHAEFLVKFLALHLSDWLCQAYS